MTNQPRRNFVKKAGSVAVITPLSLIPGARSLFAADAPMVDESSAQAIALKYATISATDGQNCSNCALYQGAEGAEAGPCALFPGMSVAGPGWCSAWVAKG